MSRIGKKPIIIPGDVTVTVADYLVTVKGPKGSIMQEFHPDIAVEVEHGLVRISPRKKTKKTPALWGLTRSLVANMVEGVTAGFRRDLEFEGIGYRVNSEGGNLNLQLGFSHPVKFPAPEGITFSVEKKCALLRERGLRVETGQFGAMMAVSLVNQGPVTLLLDSRKAF